MTDFFELPVGESYPMEELQTEDIQIVFDPAYIASMIIFENAHDLAHILATQDSVVAAALYEELSYWKDAGRF